MSKERSGFWNQGSLGWGIGIGITLGTVSYLLSRRPHRKAISQNSFHPPIHLPDEGIADANLGKGLSEAASGAGEAPVREIQDQKIIKGG